MTSFPVVADWECLLRGFAYLTHGQIMMSVEFLRSHQRNPGLTFTLFPQECKAHL
ncbi:hypothetical protein ACWATR_02315 [Nostoc sp. UIC 10890]